MISLQTSLYRCDVFAAARFVAAILLVLLVGAVTSRAAIQVKCTPASGPVEVAVPYSTTCNDVNGATMLNWTVTGLPSGVTVTTPTASVASITISGTPAAASNGSFMVMATDGVSPNTLAVNYSIASTPSVTTCPTIVNAEQNVAITPVTCTATGGAGALTFSFGAGNHTGLSISSFGVISGTPTSATTLSYNVIVTDSLNVSSIPFPVSTTVAATPSVTTCPTIVNAEQNVAITPVTCIATGGAGMLTFSFGTGNHAGLAISSSGVISGTPTSSTTLNYNVIVTDSLNVSSAPFAVTTSVNSSPSVTMCPTIVNAEQNVAIASVTCTAAGGIGTLSFSFGTGNHAGLAISSSGVISGTPTSSGTLSYNVIVTDTLNASSAPFLVTTIVAATPSVTMCPAIVNAEQNVPITPVTCTASGGIGALSFSFGTGNHAGLAISSSGVISGTPTSSGTLSYNVIVTDTLIVSSAPFPVTTTVAPPPSVTMCPMVVNAEQNVPITPVTCTAAGGVGTLSYSFAAGNTAGLMISSSGVISGSPASSGTLNFNIVVTDTLNVQSAQFPIATAVAPPLTAPICTLTGTTEVGVTPTVTCPTPPAGGVTPYTWALVPVAPPGLAINPMTGAVSGMFTGAGNYPFQVQVTDSALGTPVVVKSGQLGGTIIPAPSLSCAPATGPITLGSPYSSVCSVAQGTGTPNYTFAVVPNPDPLPPGLTTNQNSTNQFSVFGVPSGAARTYSYSIKVTDNATQPQTSTVSFTANLSGGLNLTCSNNSGPVEVGLGYSQVCTASGGIQPYTFPNPGLPGGLAYTTNATAITISGPAKSAVSSYSFKVQVTDSTSIPQTASQSFSGSIAASPTANCAGSAGTLEVGVPYSNPCSVTGGIGPFTWSISSGTLPGGISLPTNPTGATVNLAGTSSSSGTFSWTVRVTDVNGLTSDFPYTSVSFAAKPSINCSTASAPAEVGDPYSVTCTASGGTGLYLWTVSLPPPGLSAGTPFGSNNSMITISGAPSSVQANYSFTVMANDSASTSQASSLKTFSGPIVPGPSLTCTNNNGPIEAGVPYTTTCSVAPGTGTGPYASSNFSFSTALNVNGLTASFAPATGNSPPTFTVSGVPTGVNGSLLTAGAASLAYAFQIQVTDNAPGAPQVAYSPLFNGNLASQPAISCIEDSPNIVVSPGHGPATVNQAYSNVCTVSGGVAPYNWTTTFQGASPPYASKLSDLGLAETTPGSPHSGTSYTISGTPTQAIKFDYLIAVTDGQKQISGSVEYTNAVASVLSLTCDYATLTTEVGASVSNGCTAQGGSPPYYFQLTSMATLQIVTVTGTTAAARFTFNLNPTILTPSVLTDTVSVRDSNTIGSPRTAVAQYNLVTRPAMNVICTTTTGPAQVGVAYSDSCSVTGGIPPYVWTLNGQLPTGIQMFSAALPTTNQNVISGVDTVTISGKPQQAGSFLYGFSVNDAGPSQTTSGGTTTSLMKPGGPVYSVPFSGSISPGLTMTCSPTTGPMEAGENYTATCTAQGGTPPYASSFTGAYPPGISLSGPVTAGGSSVWTISGTPLSGSAPQFNYTFSVTDSLPGTPATVSQTFSGSLQSVPFLTCDLGAPSGSTAVSLNASVGVPFTTTCAVSGGTPNFTWNVSGAPAGLNLNSTSGSEVTFSGTPAQTGSFALTISVTDQYKVVSTYKIAALITSQVSITTSVLPGSDTSYKGKGIALGVTINNNTSTPFASQTSFTIALTQGLTFGNVPVSSEWTCTLPDATNQNLNCARSSQAPPIAANMSSTVFAAPVIAIGDQACNGVQPSYTATVFVASSVDNKAYPNGTSSANVLPTGCLSITKTHPGSFPVLNPDGSPGGGTYTITAQNPTQTSITGATVVVSDQLDSRLSVNAAAFVGANPNCAATQSSDMTYWTVSCTYTGDVTPGQSFVISLPVTVSSAAACGLISDAATVLLTTPSGVFMNSQQSSASDPTSISGNGCLSLFSKFTPPSAPGSTGATYVVYASNTGEGTVSATNTANPPAVRINLPAGFSYTGADGGVVTDTSIVPAPDGSTWNCDPSASPAITCTLLKDLSAGAQAVLNMHVSAPTGKGNCLYMTPIDQLYNGTVKPGALSVPATIPAPGCLTISRAYPQFVTPGPSAAYTYSLQVGTPANSTVAGSQVAVTESLPAGITATKVDGGANWNCSTAYNGTKQTITCTNSSQLASGSFDPITVTFTSSVASCPLVNGTSFVAVDGVANAATVDGLPVTNCLAVTFLTSTAPAYNSSSAYSISTAYLGTAALVGTVKVTATFPVGVTPTSVVSIAASSPAVETPTNGNGNDWTCDLTNTPTISCTRPAPGTWNSLKVYANVTGSACLPNRVTDNAAFLNSAVQSSDTQMPLGTVAGCPQGSLTLVTKTSQYIVGGPTGTYTLTVSNTKPILQGQQVTLTDIFPTGLKPQSVDGGSDWTCSVIGQIVACTSQSTKGSNLSFSDINVVIQAGNAACPAGRDNPVLALVPTAGGDGVPQMTSPTLLKLTGCITTSPPTVSYTTRPQVGGKNVSQSVFVTVADTDPLDFVVAKPANSSYTISSVLCPKVGQDGSCAFTLANDGVHSSTAEIDIAFSPLCIGPQSDVLVITSPKSPKVFADIKIGLSGAGYFGINPVLYDTSAGLPLASTVSPINPAVATPGPYNLGVFVDPGGPVCTPQAPAQLTPAITFLGIDRAPGVFDENVSASPSCNSKYQACANFQSGTVAGNISLGIGFINGTTPVPYDTEMTPGSGSALKTTVALKPSAPVIPDTKSVTKGPSTSTSVEIDVVGYSTDRNSQAKADVEICFRFAAAPGTTLDSSALSNGCYGGQAIEDQYELTRNYVNGSVFQVSNIFPFSGDLVSIGTVEVWLQLQSNSSSTSQHYCMDFKSGNVKQGSCGG